ncbi:hypothetical protein HMPREF9104_00519, partial [Lentilactobacillus kisonensis F0435]
AVRDRSISLPSQKSLGLGIFGWGAYAQIPALRSGPRKVSGTKRLETGA